MAVPMAEKLKKQHIDTLVHGRWIIPVEPQQTVLENHCIAVENGNIVAIIPSTETEHRYLAKQVYHLDRHVLLPGLINSHGHAAMSLLRGYADDKPLMDWLENHIWPAEAANVGEEFVHDGSMLALAEMIRSGTTCFSDMYFFPNVTARLCQEAGMRAQLSFPIFDFPSAWGDGPDDYISKGLNLRDDFKHSDLITIVFGPHSPYTVAHDKLGKVATLAAELDTAIHIHLQETADEIQQSIDNHQRRPLEIINDLGLLGPRSQCVHMTQVNESDLQLLSTTGAHVIHCPQSNMKLASGICPTPKLLDHGINVALGTDSAASNNSLDMFQEMRTAALLAKVSSNDPSALPAHQALAMATINGAKAMGIDNRLGSLKQGKYADFIAVDLGNPATQPVHDCISQLVYAVNSRQVSHSWIAGKLMMENGKLTTLNTKQIVASAGHWQQKMTT
jgi:5-methylthioadenosine/S-adenosylhomocysteine deaminase